MRIMKNIWMIISLLLFAACSNDEDYLEVAVPEDCISFEEIQGGAIMRYHFSAPTDVYAVCARYNDAQGREVMLQSSVMLDSICLVGFNEARQNVPIAITFLDKNNLESKPMYRTFNTLASSPYAFLDSVQVNAGWNGITLDYRFTGEETGLVNVFYVGKNPYTGKMDTLYVDNLNIENGENSIFLGINFDQEENSVVLKTEDFRGYNVRTKVWNGIKSYPTQQLATSDFVLKDPDKWSLEDDTKKYGIKYLTDGDTKGFLRFENKKSAEFYTYITRAGGADGSYLIIDMQQPRVPASVRLFAMFNLTSAGLSFRNEFYSGYDDWLPSSITLYGSNDEKNWVKLGSYYQNPTQQPASAGWGYTYVGPVKTREQMEMIDPLFCDVVCSLGETAYRYLKVECNDVFNIYPGVYGNNSRYASYHELEVYVKKN